MLKFRKRTSPWSWFGGIVAVLVIFLIWQFIAFQFAMTRMPAGWTISGADVAGMSYQQAVSRVGETLTQKPVQLGYFEHHISLDPAEIDVSFNPTQTLETIVMARDASGDAHGFLTYIIRHAPPPQDVPASLSWSDEKLRAYLTQVAGQYDLRPQSASPILEGLRMAAGRAGHELDISASVSDVAIAIASADTNRRTATLTVKTVPPPPPPLSALDSLIQVRLRDFQGLAGIFIKDLGSGEEYGVNDDVAFSGMGVIKLAIMVEIYRKYIHVSERDARLIEEMITTESGNGAANALLQKLGNGDAYAGAKDFLTPAMKYLGLVNTFAVIPYDQNAAPLVVITPANSRTDISTAPDPKMQTTPRDVGLLLDMIYGCSKGGGTLLVAYPNAFTPDECQDMLDTLARNPLNDRSGQAAYLASALPEGVHLARKYSWSDHVRADGGIVFSPGRDYVLVVFLYVPAGGEWEQANPIFKDISQAAYNFFNAGQ